MKLRLITIVILVTIGGYALFHANHSEESPKLSEDQNLCKEPDSPFVFPKHDLEFDFMRWADTQTPIKASGATLKAIAESIRHLSSEKILSIKVYRDGKAIVETGLIEGNLSGSGMCYYLEYIKNKWKVRSTCNWVS